ncbi:MAG: N-6 DNA methylase [Gemmatimonadetes bacterium]|nr:N-6 DNA methylase [Gemmatimonadota bacterium]
MLDTETKRRIDTARDILVGKVPDPKSQVEQITIALIYKFMNDMDAKAEEFGGERQFFAGEFAQYGWAGLMHGGLSGHDVLNLYATAITRMPENPGIPPLFRDIFNNAYLPYRDPETLRAFLKIIDEFTYDHSERLGDAFEYLLSVLGSQGDAGQFRTPRHIIDFIVAIIDPKKDEKVLDPACGTAGFLISSWKHIEKAETDEKGNSTLTPDEKGRLAQNFCGYDISPDMVRLSLVNMYLHGFAQPRIHEYDTLTSEDRWNEFADVILANPPFMSPKGGIRPHNRFSVKSKRSEVLFVDYMAEHLTPDGRAGIIVPEGIIFQSQNAHRQLRRKLVEDYLVAVISLPAGVFNPYSGVKTSILILDRKLAKQTDHIAFYKVENDGFDLGAQRRVIETNDLPIVQMEIGEYLQLLRSPELMEDVQRIDVECTIEMKVDNVKDVRPSAVGLVVQKEKIAEMEYNLGIERYRDIKEETPNWPMVSLGSIATIESGSRQKGGALSSGTPSIGGEQIDPEGNIRFDKMKYITEEHFESMTKGVLKKGDVLIVKDGATTGKTGYFTFDIKASVNEHVFILRARNTINSYYLYSVIKSSVFQNKLKPYIKGIIGGISLEIQKIEIPVPSMETQEDIVAELMGYQRVIDGAKAVIENWKPKIVVDSEWPMVELGTMAEVIAGQSPPGESYNNTGLGTPFYQGKTEFGDVFIGEPMKWTTDPKRIAEKDDILLSVRAPVGPVNLATHRICIGRGLAAIRPVRSELVNKYTFYILRNLESEISGNMGAAFSSINLREIRRLKIPLPPVETQLTIVAEIETERKLVDANRGLVKRMEENVQATVRRMWGEDYGYRK